MHFYYNFSKNVCPKHRPFFVKNIYIVITLLKVSKYCDLKKIKHDIGSNFVKRIRAWFSEKDFRFMKKWCNYTVSTLHIWMNSHTFPKTLPFS